MLSKIWQICKHWESLHTENIEYHMNIQTLVDQTYLPFSRYFKKAKYGPLGIHVCSARWYVISDVVSWPYGWRLIYFILQRRWSWRHWSKPQNTTPTLNKERCFLVLTSAFKWNWTTVTVLQVVLLSINCKYL